MRQTYTLLDIRGFMLKAYHSTPEQNLRNETKGPVTAWQDALAHLMDRWIFPLLEDKVTPPQNIIAVWDGGNDYRLMRYPDYKKTRLSKEKDPTVSQELKLLKEQTLRLLAYLGVKSVGVPGEEADDLMALLCRQLEADRILVKTIDSDLLQLVDERVSVMLDNDLYAANLEPSWKIPYPLIALEKALCGDTSDEYGGVNRFGPKTWNRMIAEYGEDGMEQLLKWIESNDLETVTAMVVQTRDTGLKLIRDNWDAARLGLDLAQLHPEVCYGVRDRKPKRPVWHARVPDAEKVTEILSQIGQANRAVELSNIFPVSVLIETDLSSSLEKIAEDIVNSPVVSWDYESSDKVKWEPFKRAKKDGKYVDVLSQEVAGVSINYGQFLERTVYIPFDHKETGNLPAEWLSWVLQVLATVEPRTVAQNAAFELTLSRNLPSVPAPYDTSIMASYVDENEPNNLKAMSLRYLGYRQATYEETTQGRDMCDMTGQEVLSYGCDDSLVTSHLFVLFRTIMQLEGNWEFYRNKEVEPVEEDVNDFVAGQEIDYARLEELKEESGKMIEARSQQMRDLLAEHVNEVPEEEVFRRAKLVYDEWMVTKRVELQEDEDKLRKAEAELWEKAWYGCFYRPLEKTVTSAVFVSTKGMINKVIEAIDPKAPQIEKVSKPGVEDLDSKMSDYLDRPVNEKDAYAEADQKLSHFVGFLYRAANALSPSKRSGPEYEKLCEFANSILQGSGQGKVSYVGDQLNLNSTPQMQMLLYGKLGLPVRRRSKVGQGSLREREKLKGGPATGNKAIETAFVYDLPEGDDWRKDVLLYYKEMVQELQNLSLYYDPYPLWKHPSDGKVHPQIKNCGTVTRRPSGTSPNVLQVSKKEEGKIRQVYLPGKDCVTVSADFANQELVILACEAQDPVMLDAFMSTPRKDLHSVTSCGYTHVLLPRIMPGLETIDPVTYEEFMDARQGTNGDEIRAAVNQIRNKFSKAVNFLMAYLGGYTTLAANLLIPEDLAKQLMQSTFQLYPRLGPWQQEVIEFARTHGYTETAYGNRRHAAADLWSEDDFLRKRMERQMVNYIIQGGAADLLKVVRQAMHDRKMQQRYRTTGTKPVYDEICANVPIAAVADYCEELVETMSVTMPGHAVGMMVELSIGNTWGNQVELKGTSREEVEEVLEGLQGAAKLCA